jgi:hypothetical protein
MTIKIYSKHYCSEGKWDAFLLVNENAVNDSASDYREAMKMLLQTHYEASAVAIAVEMLQTILGAVEVEIGQLWGPKIVIKSGD